MIRACILALIALPTGTTCKVGTYLPSADATACLNCVAGTFRDHAAIFFSPTAPCSRCSLGEYASGSGMTSCASCGAGTYQSAFAGTTCLVCEAGTMSGGNTMSRICYGCGQGTFASAPMQSACTLCSAGKYQEDFPATTCAACTPGFYCGVGADGWDRVPCADGTYSTAEGLTSGDPCITCDIGTFSDGTAATSCAPCEPGTFGTAPGLYYRCAICLPGTFSNMTPYAPNAPPEATQKLGTMTITKEKQHAQHAPLEPTAALQRLRRVRGVPQALSPLQSARQAVAAAARVTFRKLVQRPAAAAAAVATPHTTARPRA